jgi:hypothetical protein
MATGRISIHLWLPVVSAGRAIRIGSETKLIGRSPVRVTINHAGGFGDLVDQSFFRGSNRAGDGVLYKLDFKELREVAFASHFEFCAGKPFDKVVDILLGSFSNAPIVDIQDH